MAVSLLHYRPWRGVLRGPAWSILPTARVGLGVMFRRKLFWGLYALSLLFFLMFFFGQYLLAYADTGKGIGPFISQARTALKLDGSAEQFRVFFGYQGTMVVILLALAGSVLVGNDYHFGSLPFYLSKPLGPWHYLCGKCLAVAVFINLLTTLPALVLYVQYGLLTNFDYFLDNGQLLAGILGYGLVLTLFLSLLLVATASWLRQTIPLVMAWTTLFLFLRMMSASLVRTLKYDPRWRLVDLWNDLSLVGGSLLGLQPPGGRHPAPLEAAVVLCGVGLLCLSYLNRRIRAVEIIR